MSNELIEVRNVRKVFSSKKKEVVALDEVSFSVDKGEFVTIVGASGCGKSTLLNMIAGLDFPTMGTVIVDGKAVVGPSVDRGMVFQTYTLFPWLTVEENIKFGLKLKKTDKQEMEGIVEKYLKLIGLEKFRKCLPKELSGGMKQRVAIARALANNPKILLMDEPYGALDQLTKAKMQEQLLHIWETEKTTIVFITHDIEEAVFISQRVIAMTSHPGKIVDIVDIPFPNGRTLDLKDTPEFIDLRKYVTKYILNN